MTPLQSLPSHPYRRPSRATSEVLNTSPAATSIRKVHASAPDPATM
jgi:hypothetical protein